MNTPGKAPQCSPTWRGHIETTKDALLIFEACFSGQLAHCFRRPHDRERNQLIVSGNVFVYEEATSGIKRWTDGIPWSPSRILTNFLIYRQLNSPFPPGEKKRATKRSQRSIKPGDYPASATSTPVTDESRPFPPESPNPSLKTEGEAEKDVNRGLVGSLVDSYEFKENGLLKKTMTVTVSNVQHHLVSYYSLEDAKTNLKTPRDDPILKDLRIRDALLNQPKFKFPNLDDAGDGTYDQMDGPQNQYQAYGYPYDPRMYGVQGPPVTSMHGGYPTAAYAPNYHPTSNGAYSTVAASSSHYATTMGGGHYPQHNNINHQHQYPHLTQQPQYHTPQHHQQYQQAPQYAGDPQEQQLQHQGYQSPVAANPLPRPSGMITYPGVSAEAGLPQEQYAHNPVKLETPTQQSWPMHQYGQPAPWRPDGQYSDYRAQT